MLFFFFFNDTATTEIYTLSLHDALPIFADEGEMQDPSRRFDHRERPGMQLDRKSTRLNSSHLVISYAVFCLKKKKLTQYIPHAPHGRSPDHRGQLVADPRHVASA